MSEARRRKKVDPSYGKSAITEVLLTQFGVLIVFGQKKGMPLCRDRLIAPGFNPDKFDYEDHHTVVEWQSYFFSISPDAAEYDNKVAKLDRSKDQKEFAAVMAHTMAFASYIDKKNAKGLVTDFEKFNLLYYKNATLNSVTVMRDGEGVKRVENLLNTYKKVNSNQ